MDGGVSHAVAMAALDCTAVPLLLLDPGGKVVHANGAAERLLGASRTFRLHAGALSVQRQRDQDAIAAAIATCLQTRSSSTLQMHNRQGDVQHLLAFSALPDETLVAVSIAEMRGPLTLPRGWSRIPLSLPPASAELAESLVEGENLAEFADRAGLSIGGARTRLKKLLRRMGARSQSDLVMVLLRTAASLPIRS